MKITILTYGSRGDVQPFIPLSLALMARGHDVKLAAPARFGSLIEEQKIHFVPFAGDPEALSRELNDSGRNVIKIMRGLLKHAVEIGADVLRQTENACEDSDLIVHTFMHSIGAHTLAREMNIPDIHIQIFPMFTPTGDYPNVSLPDLKLRSLNRWTHTISSQVAFWSSRVGYDQVRRRAGIPNRKLHSPFVEDPVRPRTPILCAWSPSVIPPSTDWPSNVHVTGYLFTEQYVTFQPTTDLQKFLDGGEPPVCVSFGSMLNRDAAKIDHIVREALKQTNNRGIILKGWSDVKHSSSNEILYLEDIPHQWLLPRCRMIVHHGGAGTTSASLRAGIPSIVIPHMADQPFWGSRVHAIGAGPRPIPINELSVPKLTRAMTESSGSMIRKHAQAIANQLRSEDGVGHAVSWIEKYSNDFLRKDL